MNRLICLLMPVLVLCSCDPAEELGVNSVANASGDVLSGDFTDDNAGTATAQAASVTASTTNAVKAARYTVVCVGDSLTSENGDQSWPRQLSRMVDWHVVGAGRGGERLSQVTGRVRGLIGKYRPDVVIVLAGANDVTAGFTQAGITAAVRSAAAPASANHIRLVFMTTPAFTRGAASGEPAVLAYNAALSAAAASVGAPVVDVHAALSGCSDCYDPDGIHLTPQGSLVIAEVAAGAL